MRLYRWLLASLLALTPAFATAAQSNASVPAPRLDVYFDALAKNQLANGSIAISQKGVLKYQRSVGFATNSNGRQEPADAATRYRIGSVSQLFTATMVMQLVEGASVTLDSKLAEFYADLPNALDITYRDLLQHRSGLASYTDAADFQKWRTAPKTHADILKIIAAAGARFPPRERVEYNDSNYLLLGYVLEKIYERSYDEILTRRIAGKLGLSRTYYMGGGLASLESVSYVFTPQGWVAQAPTDPSIQGGAGGIVSTPAELVQFIDALFARKMVTEQSLATMRNQGTGASMGLLPYTVAGQTGYGHGGSIEAFRSCVYHFPDSGISIAYATNASVLSMDEIVDEVLSLIFERGKPPTFEPVKLSSSQQAEYLGSWHSAAGAPARTQFRRFRAPEQPIELAVKAGAGAPVVTMQGRDFQLVALGGHEFALRELGYFLRFDPRAADLVVRGPEWSYYLKRAG